MELKLIVTPELLSKLEKLKGWMAHSNPHMSTIDLIDKLCDQAISDHEKKLESKIPTKRKRCVKDDVPSLGVAGFDQSESAVDSACCDRSEVSEPKNIRRKHIAIKVKREVWRKAHSQCENCGSTYALETDHRIPLASGGSDEAENLRVLCRSCNQRAAIEKFGLSKMQTFLG